MTGELMADKEFIAYNKLCQKVTRVSLIRSMYNNPKVREDGEFKHLSAFHKKLCKENNYETVCDKIEKVLIS